MDTAADLVDALAKKGMIPKPITAGMAGTFGEIVLNVLNPTTERLQEAWDEIEHEQSDLSKLQEAVDELCKVMGVATAPATSAENNSSVVIELIYRGTPYALLTGDAGAAILTEVTQGRQYQFLKVPHHGSKTGLDEALIEQIKPAFAYIPVGENQHGHPCIEILDMLRDQGAKTLCSEKTVDCRRSCPAGGFGDICHGKDKLRAGWYPLDAERCANNKAAAKAISVWP
ncbi:MAG: ComEC/Rec2 family competence protein [Bryobacteraceae bacterium]